MPESTLNVIVGGLLALIPAAFIAVISHILQISEKRKQREREIITKRIDLIEQGIYESFKWFMSYYPDVLSSFIRSKEPRRNIFLPRYIQLLDFFPLLSQASTVKDVRLDKLINSYLEEINKANARFSKIEKENSQPDEYLNKLKEAFDEFHPVVRESFIQVISRIDKIKIKI